MSVKYQFIKTDSGEIIVKDPQKLARHLHKLKPGHYAVDINMVDDRLARLKKYYFTMESSLAHHIGTTKRLLHRDIQEHTDLGRRVDPDSGEVVYESISDVKDYDTMLARVFEFQQWAASEYNYTFEPYKDDADGTDAHS